MSGTKIHFPTDEEKAEALAEFGARMRAHRAHAEEAIAAAVPAMDRLVDVMRHKTGQGYKLRALLYSLWNGQPASLVEVVNLDTSIRKDFSLVFLAFGLGAGDVAFFYDAVEKPIRNAGLFDWFLEEFKPSLAAFAQEPADEEGK
jgi:hypothetical protein